MKGVESLILLLIVQRTFASYRFWVLGSSNTRWFQTKKRQITFSDPKTGQDTSVKTWLRDEPVKPTAARHEQLEK